MTYMMQPCLPYTHYQHAIEETRDENRQHPKKCKIGFFLRCYG